MDSCVPIPANSDFTLSNMPYGIFSTESEPNRRVGVAIGEHILDLSKVGCFCGPILSKCCHVFKEESLHDFMELGPAAWSEARQTIHKLLSSSEGMLRDNTNLSKKALIPQAEARLHLPAKIGDLTDFSASKKHAENDRIMFTDDNLQINQNWNYMPVAYHSRASSIIPSGTAIRRPNGQRLSSTGIVTFGPTEQLDFEVELGALIGRGNDLGRPIPVDDAEKHVFGMVLLNDWSARDMQSWEWKPLGCFLSKSYATTISPWVVTMEALQPFRCDMLDVQKPTPLPYLQHRIPSTFDISLHVHLSTEGAESVTRLSTTNYKVTPTTK
ncbi:hypothetical protein RvY_16949-2 [Ramazzottius varieornatus]|uniref:Fumarylacetoacetase n=1 Tax=Ramazzottius varieornatus TaxID=947166 RepID=A0A1D1W0D3_RAMVA|nr:hypothetical protein RvY_16949-2 [Ramazzottius varieornatus]